MKTCFLLTHVPNPRINKRIFVAKKAGEVVVICTRRSSQNIWEPFYKDVEHIIFDIDLPSSRQILKRYIVSRIFTRKVMNAFSEIQPDCIYAESLDSLMCAVQYKRHIPSVRIIYEIADVQAMYLVRPRSILRKLELLYLNRILARCFSYVDFLVITSKPFYSRFACQFLSEEKVIYIPNIPNINVFRGYQKKSSGVFTIGFIGGIRYLKQMKMLVEVAGQCGFNVAFFGAGGTTSEYTEITTYCRDKSFVRFHGKYQYEKDIAHIYSSVDCVYAVYDADNPNVRIALPNKLYESIYCEIPILVAKGTYLSELVEKWGVGVAVSHTDYTELKKVLLHLSSNQAYYDGFVQSCKLHKDVLYSENYNKQLRNALLGLDN